MLGHKFHTSPPETTKLNPRIAETIPQTEYKNIECNKKKKKKNNKDLLN